MPVKSGSDLMAFLRRRVVATDCERALHQLNHGIERTVLVIGRAATFPSDMRLIGNALFQHLKQSRLPDARLKSGRARFCSRSVSEPGSAMTAASNLPVLRPSAT